MEIEHGQLPPPPGLITSLMAGFDSVANHIAVILPPLLLDMFLWLGPRLQLKEFIQLFTNQMPSLASAFPSGFPDLETVRSFWTSIAEKFNLFVVLRTFPIGITSLLSLKSINQNSLGLPLSLDAGSFLGILTWVAILSILGWVSGALYFYWVSNVSLKLEARPLFKAINQAVLLSVIWTGLLIFLGMPALMIFSILTIISPTLGQVALFVVAIFLVWLVLPVFFSAHGIFALQMDALRAILNSLHMVRFTLPNTGLFLMLFLVINQGLNFLWNTPSPDSWWMLVGILGHAFVSTALLAASFIYYRDVNIWLKAVLEQLQRQTNSVKA